MAKYVIEVLLPPAVRERQGNRRGISEPALGSPPGWTCLGQHPRKLAHVDMDELLYWELLNPSLRLCPAIPRGFTPSAGKKNSGFWMCASFTSLAFGLFFFSSSFLQMPLCPTGSWTITNHSTTQQTTEVMWRLHLLLDVSGTECCGCVWPLMDCLGVFPSVTQWRLL